MSRGVLQRQRGRLLADDRNIEIFLPQLLHLSLVVVQLGLVNVRVLPPTSVYISFRSPGGVLPPLSRCLYVRCLVDVPPPLLRVHIGHLGDDDNFSAR